MNGYGSLNDQDLDTCIYIYVKMPICKHASYVLMYFCNYMQMWLSVGTSMSICIHVIGNVMQVQNDRMLGPCMICMYLRFRKHV